MTEVSRQAHWENVYATRGEREVSWFQERPAPSLDLIRAAGATPRSSVIDVGGGASRLVDALLADGFTAVTVLDISEAALATAKRRLGSKAADVTWIVADITTWEPPQAYDLWHDRAVLHFLTDASDRAAYVTRLKQALRSGGHAIISTFALDGPERCSGLPVVRYDAKSLAELLGNEFDLIETRTQDHPTPMGGVQRFQFSVFRRR
jgi:SAM-dependent methyltransferase